MKTTIRTKDKHYDILIGNDALSKISQKNDILSKERFTVIVSSNVYSLHQDYIKNIFKQYTNYDIIEMKDGEENKNYKYAENFFARLLESGCTRKSVVIGIGGGAVGDFSGFIAALYMRGVPLIHIPTTLLAMVDSSIGGKTAVNISYGKNIVGAFYQPELVISDTNFLKTLPDHEFKNGLTEVLKHAIIGENELLNILLKNSSKSIRESDSISIVYHSAKFKSDVVEKDEKEGGLRAILNFGHTVGHALESLLEHRGISHGEAVAIGIYLEAEISRRLGLLSDDEMKLIVELIKKYNLIYNEYKLDSDDIIKHMKFDKKNTDGKIRFVLLKGIGNPVYDQLVEEKLLEEIINSFKK